MKQQKKLTIRITGPAGAGKTMLGMFVANALGNAGLPTHFTNNELSMVDFSNMAKDIQEGVAPVHELVAKGVIVEVDDGSSTEALGDTDLTRIPITARFERGLLKYGPVRAYELEVELAGIASAPPVSHAVASTKEANAPLSPSAASALERARKILTKAANMEFPAAGILDTIHDINVLLTPPNAAQ